MKPFLSLASVVLLLVAVTAAPACPANPARATQTFPLSLTAPQTPGSCGTDNTDYNLGTIYSVTAGAVVTQVSFIDCGGHSAQHTADIWVCAASPSGQSVITDAPASCIKQRSDIPFGPLEAASGTNAIRTATLTTPLCVSSGKWLLATVKISGGTQRFWIYNSFSFPTTGVLSATGSKFSTVAAPNTWMNPSPSSINYFISLSYHTCTATSLLTSNKAECNSQTSPITALATDSTGCTWAMTQGTPTESGTCPKLGTVGFSATAANAAAGGSILGEPTCCAAGIALSGITTVNLQATVAGAAPEGGLRRLSPAPATPANAPSICYLPPPVQYKTGVITYNLKAKNPAAVPDPAVCPINAYSATQGWIKVKAWRKQCWDCDCYPLDLEDVYVGDNVQLHITQWPIPGSGTAPNKVSKKECPLDYVPTYNFDEYPYEFGVIASDVWVDFKRSDKCGLTSCGCTPALP